jgi:hypothetical protein
MEIGIEMGPTWALNLGPPRSVGERPASPSQVSRGRVR